MSRLYVYAFIGEPGRRCSIRGRTIEMIPVGRVHAAVERRRGAPRLTEAALQEQHAIVAELAGRVDAILPARFGAFVDDRELERIVIRSGARLRTALERVRGCVQMTVRISSQAPAAPLPGTSRERAGTEYLTARRAALAESPETDLIREAVRAVAVGESLTTAGPYTTVAHLVPRRRVSAYRRAIEAAIRKADPGSRVRVTGPWPPFAFAPDLWS